MPPSSRPAIVFLDSTIVNLALKRIGRGAAAPDVDRHPRGTGLRRQRLSGRPGGAADHRGRARRPLRPAPDLRHRPGRVRRDLGPVRSRPDPRVPDRGAPLPGGGRGAAGSGLARDHHGRVHGRGPGRAFGLWAASTSALTLLGPIIGGLLVDNLTWRLAFLINVPLVAVALCSRRSATSRSRAIPTRAATSTGSARSSARSRSAGWPSGRSTARRPTGRTRSPGSRWRSARSPRRLPDPDGDHAAPARAAVAVPEPRVRVDQPRDVPDLRRALRLVHVHRPALPGDARLHGDGRGDHRPPGGDPAGDAVGPDRGADRPVRGADVPRRGPADRGRRAALARPDPGVVASRGWPSSATPRP